MSIRKIGWGIVGCGRFVDEILAPTFSKLQDSELIAFLSRDQRKSGLFATKHGAQKGYSCMKDFLSDEKIEAVYIATPQALHHRQTIQAARAGRHVLCEKPMALSSNECQEMIKVCQDEKVNLMIGYMYRFHPAHQKIKSLMKKGNLGKPILFRSQYLLKYKTIYDMNHWRMNRCFAAGGPLVEMGPHCLDLLRFFNGEITEVSAFSDTLTMESSIEDISVLNFRFENGSYGMLDVGYDIDIQFRNYLEIYGEKGYIRTVGTIGHPPGTWIEIYLDGRTEKIDYGGYNYLDMYPEEINEFNSSIREGRSPIITGEDGLRVLEIIEAAQRSSKERRVQQVSESR